MLLFGPKGTFAQVSCSRSKHLLNENPQNWNLSYRQSTLVHFLDMKEWKTIKNISLKNNFENQQTLLKKNENGYYIKINLI